MLQTLINGLSVAAIVTLFVDVHFAFKQFTLFSEIVKSFSSELDIVCVGQRRQLFTLHTFCKCNNALA